MLQPSPASASSLADWLRSGAGRRALAIALVLLVEGLLLLLILTFSVGPPRKSVEETVTVTNLVPVEAEELKETRMRSHPPFAFSSSLHYIVGSKL